MLRSGRERIIQTVTEEAGACLLAVPLYGALFDAGFAQSLLLMVVLAVAGLIWTPVHNTAFDLADLRLSGRVASDRPHGLRMVHALSLESSTIMVTTPLIVVIGGHGIWEALAIDLGLGLIYVVYGYLFHCAYDRLRPVVPERATAGAGLAAGAALAVAGSAPAALTRPPLTP